MPRKREMKKLLKMHYPFPILAVHYAKQYSSDSNHLKIRALPPTPSPVARRPTEVSAGRNPERGCRRDAALVARANAFLDHLQRGGQLGAEALKPVQPAQHGVLLGSQVRGHTSVIGSAGLGPLRRTGEPRLSAAPIPAA